MIEIELISHENLILPFIPMFVDIVLYNPHLPFQGNLNHFKPIFSHFNFLNISFLIFLRYRNRMLIQDELSESCIQLMSQVPTNSSIYAQNFFSEFCKDKRC